MTTTSTTRGRAPEQPNTNEERSARLHLAWAVLGGGA